MTSPQDPNAPPGWGAPPSSPSETPPETQPGWGAPPSPNQPGWGPPPPPPPGAQPGWGPPPNQGYPGWPPQPQKRGHGCLIAALVVVGLLVVLVGGCAWLLGPIVGTELKLNQDLGPRAASVEFNWNNGATTFVVHLAPGYESQAESIACQIVKPDIETSSTPNARFEIVSSRGYILADDTTPCG